MPQRRSNAFAEGLKARDSTAWGEAPGPRFPENTERCKRETMPHPRPPPWAGPTALDHSSWSQPGAALPAFAPPQAVISRAFSPPVPAICNRRPWTTAVPPVFMTETRWTPVANRRHGVARHSDVATGATARAPTRLLKVALNENGFSAGRCAKLAQGGRAAGTRPAPGGGALGSCAIRRSKLMGNTGSMVGVWG